MEYSWNGRTPGGCLSCAWNEMDGRNYCIGRHAGYDFGFDPLSSRPTAHLLFHGPRWVAAPWAAKVHPRFHTPHITTIITGVIVACCSSVASIGELVDLTNVGTLFAFILVAAGIIILRYKDPTRQRPFRTPWVPWVPLGAIVSCGYLMVELPGVTWFRFFLWMALGLSIYFLYGLKRSRLRRGSGSGSAPDTKSAWNSDPSRGE